MSLLTTHVLFCVLICQLLLAIGCAAMRYLIYSGVSTDCFLSVGSCCSHSLSSNEKNVFWDCTTTNKDNVASWYFTAHNTKLYTKLGSTNYYLQWDGSKGAGNEIGNNERNAKVDRNSGDPFDLQPTKICAANDCCLEWDADRDTYTSDVSSASGVVGREAKFDCNNNGDPLEFQVYGAYSFNSPAGRWVLLYACAGCDTNSYTKEQGVETATGTSTTSEYSSALEASVSAGFSFYGASVSATVTGSLSQSTSHSVHESTVYDKKEITSLSCPAKYFYQWRMSFDEMIDATPSGKSQLYSNEFLCTNYRDPKCPPPYCVDVDCRACTAEYNAGNVVNVVNVDVAIYDSPQPQRPPQPPHSYLYSYYSWEYVMMIGVACGTVVALALILCISCCVNRCCSSDYWRPEKKEKRKYDSVATTSTIM